MKSGKTPSDILACSKFISSPGMTLKESKNSIAGQHRNHIDVSIEYGKDLHTELNGAKQAAVTN